MPNEEPKTDTPAHSTLEQGTYEVLRARLADQASDLRARLETLNAARQRVFGSVKTELLDTDRITTTNNCLARDLVPIGGDRFLFGYNVHLGLRTEMRLEDVFAVYEFRDQRFHPLPLDAIADPQFEADFKSLYRYYKNTVFAKFALIEGHLFFEFRIGKNATDLKTFKWHLGHNTDDRLHYLGNRFDHEYRFPPQHEFEWIRTHRELHRGGLHPHISIEDRVFVECVGGDLTIKVEDNTDSGEGIYSEPVEHRDQTLDDAEIHYATVGHLILLKIRPYQENTARHFVFNEKANEVRRIDSIVDSCIRLPDDQGIAFPQGIYLQSGEYKQFDTPLSDMRFYKRIASPNGEDSLLAFYSSATGDYALFSYNRVARTVETPIICGGFSLFENGAMIVFRSSAEAQRHHALQVWRTPFSGVSWQPPVETTSFLYKIGNTSLVNAMAECHGVLNLLGKEDSYGGLYLDLVKQTTAILDSYFWLGHEECAGLGEPLAKIKEAATSALAEFDKVAAIRKNTQAETQRVISRGRKVLSSSSVEHFDSIQHFVERLASLRAVRGELISLRELRYVDANLVSRTEQDVISATELAAEKTVAFLSKPEALDPIRGRVASLKETVATTPKVTDAVELEKRINACAGELDLLIETVGNLKIKDTTETTRIVETIGIVYGTLNQARSGLKQRIRELRGTEASAEFAWQNRLLDQALANYIDLGATPQRCDEYLNRILVQVEELEARFADFEEFVVELAEKRSTISSAFEQRKIELVEARSKKAGGLLSAADRILRGIKHRAESATDLDELNSYFATDAMVEKVRALVEQLVQLEDTTKADDIASRLKTVREDAVRQLKDRQELFVGGANAIQLGTHQFLVNTQPLELTIVPRGEALCLHITGTNFFEEIEDGDFQTTQPVWDLEWVSETAEIYRGEWLAYQTFKFIQERSGPSLGKEWNPDDCLKATREAAASRLREGYQKGVHDADAALILTMLLKMHRQIGLLRYPSQARACASVFWEQFPEGERKSLITARLRGFGAMKRVFPNTGQQRESLRELHHLIDDYIKRTGLFPEECSSDAAEYLYYTIKREQSFVVSRDAAQLTEAFESHVTDIRFAEAFRAAREAVKHDHSSHFQLLREWIQGYAGTLGEPGFTESICEAAWLLLRGVSSGAAEVGTVDVVAGLSGSHTRIQGGKLTLHYLDFMRRMRSHEATVVPLHERFMALKRQFMDDARKRLRLDEFKPKVLTSFVRNRLIDSTYLPLIGSNLAKQIGAAGDTKRTDRMGLLLLISPPGYGKTTLVEYAANRLGLAFTKINGPAIGHRVHSLDPAETPNAAARDELTKLNLAFEMGDNVMICLDDIQHLSAEFLQKFISLCDGSRRIEGVHRGQPRTYDLRGRKVAIVMAGNPYTESGEKFRIPDMLANRADTYNLGDVAGSHAAVFRSSYLENAAGANVVLARLAGKNPKDIAALVDYCESNSSEPLQLESTWSAEEIGEFRSVMQKLIRVRNVVLRINEEYIRSAAQADAYRTEPAFKLQGSYRNMNRLAEKISAIMNDNEVEQLIAEHYRNEAQTLTNGAEANLLKYKELTETLDPAEATRWEEIRKTFRKNQVLGGSGEEDPVNRVVQRLAAFYDGLGEIKTVLETIAANSISTGNGRNPMVILTPPSSPTSAKPNLPPKAGQWTREVAISEETLRKIWELIEAEKANTNPSS